MKACCRTGPSTSMPGFNRPGSILVSEAFLIEGGKIRRVEMIGPARGLPHELAVGRIERGLTFVTVRLKADTTHT